MAALASDWLTHFRLLLWNPWTKFNETWQEARSQCPLPSVCFSGRSEKQDGPPSCDWLRHFRLLLWNHWTELNETCRKQDLNILYQVCVFQADWKKQDGCPGLWLSHFGLLLCNCWTEFNETWQEARSQRPLPSLCFWGRSEKQDGRPGVWLAETFLTSPLKLLNGIQRNLTGSKILTSSTKFVFFRPMSKQILPPWLTCQKGGTLYSGALYVGLWASCFFFTKISPTRK